MSQHPPSSPPLLFEWVSVGMTQWARENNKPGIDRTQDLRRHYGLVIGFCGVQLSRTCAGSNSRRTTILLAAERTHTESIGSPVYIREAAAGAPLALAGLYKGLAHRNL